MTRLVAGIALAAAILLGGLTGAQSHEEQEQSEGFWLNVYTASWMHVFGVYPSRDDCFAAAKEAYGYSCKAPDRPDTIPNCECLRRPGSKPPASAADPLQNRPTPQNLPSPLH
jgi:hypothetical protein